MGPWTYWHLCDAAMHYLISNQNAYNCHCSCCIHFVFFFTAPLIISSTRFHCVLLRFVVKRSQVRFSLSFVGAKGSLEVQRGGWGIGRGEYTLQYKREGDPQPVKEPCQFSGFPNEVASFAVAAQQAEAGLGEGEDAYRVSCVEGARDQAVVDALLRSSAGGGGEVDVVSV